MRDNGRVQTLRDCHPFALLRASAYLVARNDNLAAGGRLMHDEPIMVLQLVRPLIGGRLGTGLHHRLPLVMEAALPLGLAKGVAE